MGGGGSVGHESVRSKSVFMVRDALLRVPVKYTQGVENFEIGIIIVAFLKDGEFLYTFSKPLYGCIKN